MNRRMIALLAVLTLLVMSIGSASAQSCPEGLSGEDCELLETAVANTSSATSFNLEFRQMTVANMGFSVTINAEGTGSIILDGAGNLVAAKLDMPAVSQDTGFFEASEGAASWVLLDGMMYFGAGESMEALEWASVSVEDAGSPELTFDALISNDASMDMTTDLPVSTEWTRNDSATTSTGASAISLSTETVDGDLMEGMGDMEGMDDMLGGMGGTYSISTAFFIDAESQQLIEYSTNASMTMDMTDMMGDIVDEAAEGEDLEGMEDLFGDAFSSFSGETNVFASFTNFGADLSGEITAPEGAEPMEATMVDTISFSYGGIPTMLSNYYSAVAAETMMGDFGDFGEFTFSDYTGNCSSDYYVLSQQEGVSIGDTINATLATDGADLYPITLNEGDTIVVDMTSEPLDTYLELLDPAGEGVISNDDTNGYNAQLNFTAETAGEYTIVACTFSGGDAGEYTLTVSN